MPAPKQIRFKIPAGSPSGYCRGCGAKIFWIETARSKKMPVDPDGTSHFATCPDATRFRRRQGRAAGVAWIAITDRQPANGEIVLLCFRDGFITSGMRNGRDWWYPVANRCTEQVTHWMPLPALPGATGEEGKR